MLATERQQEEQHAPDRQKQLHEDGRDDPGSQHLLLLLAGSQVHEVEEEVEVVVVPLQLQVWLWEWWSLW